MLWINVVEEVKVEHCFRFYFIPLTASTFLINSVQLTLAGVQFTLMGNFISSYTGTKAGTAWREKAQKYNDERAACFQKSQHYFSKGDHEAAKKWSNAGKALGQKMEDANQRAAKVIFDDLNAPGKQPDRTYDFHGLFVKEALHKLEDIVQLAEKKKWTDITIIVGRGTHSINGIAKVCN